MPPPLISASKRSRNDAAAGLNADERIGFPIVEDGSRRRPGRPPRLSLDQILDAAIEVGLADLTMAKVADRLKVAVAALYRHVENREDLLRLASSRVASSQPSFGVSDKHWTDICMDMAGTIYDFFVDRPYAITYFMEGALGPEVRVAQLEPVMMSLCAQGFSMREAWLLKEAVGHLAIGAVLTTLHRKALSAQGRSHAQRVAEVIEKFESEAVTGGPKFGGRSSEFIEACARHDWQTQVRMLLDGEMRRRGETPRVPTATEAQQT